MTWLAFFLSHRRPQITPSAFTDWSLPLNLHALMQTFPSLDNSHHSGSTSLLTGGWLHPPCPALTLVIAWASTANSGEGPPPHSPPAEPTFDNTFSEAILELRDSVSYRLIFWHLPTLIYIPSRSRLPTCTSHKFHPAIRNWPNPRLRQTPPNGFTWGLETQKSLGQLGSRRYSAGLLGIYSRPFYISILPPYPANFLRHGAANTAQPRSLSGRHQHASDARATVGSGAVSGERAIPAPGHLRRQHSPCVTHELHVPSVVTVQRGGASYRHDDESGE